MREGREVGCKIYLNMKPWQNYLSKKMAQKNSPERIVPSCFFNKLFVFSFVDLHTYQLIGESVRMLKHLFQPIL